MLQTLTYENYFSLLGGDALTDHELLKARHFEGIGWTENEVWGGVGGARASHQVAGSARCFTRTPVRVHGALG